jgi:hypothetical protein
MDEIVLFHPYLNTYNVVSYDHAILSTWIQNYVSHMKKIREFLHDMWATTS